MSTDTYLNSGGVYSDRTRGVLALQCAIHHDYVRAPVLVEGECKDHTSRACADNEDFSR